MGFHLEQPRKPPIVEAEERLTSTKNIYQRVPVIVKNRGLAGKDIPELSQSLKGMALD